ncbi:MAG: DMT family transporter [Anaerolineales bacterium]|nr:DMT family transporter [Anaerolineales bacterium]
MTIATSSTRNTAIVPYLALLTGILALSLSAMFVRWADAPGPVTGFYRMFLSTLILTPFFLLRCIGSRTVNKANIIFPILGGIFTSCDLALWNSSLAYTTAANATLLGNTAPLWVAIGAWFIFHERLPKDFWLGLILALVGAALIMGGDFLTHPRLGIGDLMASGTGVFYALYFLSTQRGRQHLDPLSYIWLVGISGSLGLLVINLIMGNPLTGYSGQTWMAFFGTALVSQIIGYISVSYALGHLPASIVAPTMVGQPITTTILAIPLLKEVPNLVQVMGGFIALMGIYLVNQSHYRGRQDTHTS